MAARPEQWRRVEKLFGQALEQPAHERSRFLDSACREPGLRQQVEALLAADGRAAGFLERPETAHPDPVSPRSIGPYRLVRKIGQGGMSEVWLAVRDDEQFRRRVALKLMRRSAASDDERYRLRRERQILASLDHPNIARLYDAGSTGDDLSYVVMELVEGEPITAYCDRLRLTVRDRLKLFRSLCTAVHYAHQNLVVHRDIKPGNILVKEDGEPKLLDFGIAKLLNPELTSENLAPTFPWHRLLTLDYASPEQIEGRTVSTASDIYSLGVLLYELLTGRVPYRLSRMTPAAAERLLAEREPLLPSEAASVRDPDAPAPEEVARRRQTQIPQLSQQLAGDLDTIVSKALSKAPQRRYESAAQFAEDLRRHEEGLPVIARRPTFGYRARRFVRRNRRAVALAVAFAGLVLASAIGLVILSLRLAEERDQAAHERDKARLFASLLKDVFEVSDPGEASLELTAQDILRRGAERVEELPVAQDEVKADLLATLGNVDRRQGLFEDAEPLLESALRSAAGSSVRTIRRSPKASPISVPCGETPKTTRAPRVCIATRWTVAGRPLARTMPTSPPACASWRRC